MSPPPTPDPSLLVHVKDDTIWKTAGTVIVSLWGLLMTLIGILYKRDQKKVAALFTWKDDVVDPALRDFPKEYVLQKSCDRRHDELMTAVKAQMSETLHVRRLLERHLGVDGNGAGP